MKIAPFLWFFYGEKTFAFWKISMISREKTFAFWWFRISKSINFREKDQKTRKTRKLMPAKVSAPKVYVGNFFPFFNSETRLRFMESILIVYTICKSRFIKFLSRNSQVFFKNHYFLKQLNYVRNFWIVLKFSFLWRVCSFKFYHRFGTF